MRGLRGQRKTEMERPRGEKRYRVINNAKKLNEVIMQMDNDDLRGEGLGWAPG